MQFSEAIYIGVFELEYNLDTLKHKKWNSYKLRLTLIETSVHPNKKKYRVNELNIKYSTYNDSIEKKMFGLLGESSSRILTFFK